MNTPLGLLEELFVDNPWRLVLSTICLNRTTRVQVDAVLFRFLELWPTPAAAAQANPADVFNVINSLGLSDKRR